jgi:hypothetical protein
MPKPVIHNTVIATAIMVHWNNPHQIWSIVHHIRTIMHGPSCSPCIEWLWCYITLCQREDKDHLHDKQIHNSYTPPPLGAP